MIVVLKNGRGPEEVKDVLGRLEALGLEGKVLEVLDRPAIHVLGVPTWPARELKRHPDVAALVITGGPRRRTRGRRFFPYHFLAWCMLLLMTVSGLVLLAAFFPPGLGRRVNFFEEPAPVRPTWYFQGVNDFLELFPQNLASLATLCLALIWLFFLLLPEIDRSRGSRDRRRLPILVIGLLILTVGLGLTFGGTLR